MNVKGKPEEAKIILYTRWMSPSDRGVRRFGPAGLISEKHGPRKSSKDFRGLVLSDASSDQRSLPNRRTMN